MQNTPKRISFVRFIFALPIAIVSIILVSILGLILKEDLKITD